MKKALRYFLVYSAIFFLMFIMNILYDYLFINNIHLSIVDIVIGLFGSYVLSPLIALLGLSTYSDIFKHENLFWLGICNPNEILCSGLIWIGVFYFISTSILMIIDVLVANNKFHKFCLFIYSIYTVIVFLQPIYMIMAISQRS